MHSARRSIVIDVPAELFYGLLTDFESYPAFLSDVVEAEVLSRDGEAWVVRFTVRVIREIQYELRLTGTPYEKVDWALTEQGFFLTNTGGWRIEWLTDTSIRATVFMDIEVGAFVPKAITNRLAAADLPAMLSEWKRRAEAVYQTDRGPAGPGSDAASEAQGSAQGGES